MDLTGEIRRLWGDSLAPVTAEIDDTVPERTRAFLTGVGLPTEPIWGLDFEHGDALAPFERAGRRCLPIAGSAGIPIFVVELDTGVVLQWPPDPAESDPPDFVNSDVGLFLLTAGRYFALIRHAGDDGTAAFRRELAAVDPDALAARTFWSYKVVELQSEDDA
ncbi:SUKH-4 family immunity protein [Actinoplanes sp. NPDC051494]|uniref:SUKH-4 family immunity protein n=1 Tax=Actinoplanes sp. NPDC051494 TaxID=3363907 RepID=UPI00379DEDE6